MVSSPVKRVSVTALDGSFGPDRERRIVVTFIPGKHCDTGPDVHDRLELRPLGTRRAESLTVVDVYRYALRCRVGRDLLEKARARKAAKTVRLAAQRQQRAERRLLR